MKIVIDARMINSSGIGKYIQKLTPSIINHFDNVKLLGNVTDIQKYIQIGNKNIIPFKYSIYSIQEQINYNKIIPKCDLFFSPHYNVPLGKVKAKKRIATVHDVFHLAFFNELNVAQKIYSKYVINRALKLSDQIITVSNFSKKEILKYTSFKDYSKINVIHNGIDIMNVSKEETTDLPKSYFLFVGNVKPHKNLERTIKAYKLFIETVSENVDKPAFLIVGKKEGFITGDNNIIQIIENDPLLRKHVIFTGWVSDNRLNKIYSKAICLIFPSYYEGFGLPPLEAMSFGVPCIVADAASIPEICNDAVLYFDPFNIESIFLRLKQIMNDNRIRQDLIKKGYENITKFTWNQSIVDHINLFEETLK